jgi:ring-1,2-phenylacetyl-CoA epoxidase subunit PaaC
MTENEALYNYCLKLGDSSLIMGHRISEWCGHGPVLEQDIALTNIALDLIGQARMLLSYAGELEGKGKTEDDLAYLRNDRQYRNALITELPNGDFGQTIIKLYIFDVYQVALFGLLKTSGNNRLSAIAEKSIKEAKYHLRYSKDWVLRLGDGTEESKLRITAGLNEIWPYFGDLFASAPGEELLVKSAIVPDSASIRASVENSLQATLEEAKIELPNFEAVMQEGSQDGIHTEYLSYILNEMQAVTRSYPGLQW